ncbi:response regulator transcription factor [Herbaspirillum sp. RV1423]|uniref:response regulator transcription factor n=1 Tax=Herbaspirillum sp. RV1423 TaxID=1443993 RepID=UPI0004B2975B|nr:response regulator transcription factor [Herbaspirillum sp. RV1423]
MTTENKRILIVEDHPIVSHVMTSMLLDIDKDLEITIKSCANTALAALQKDGQEKPWFRIFLDLDIPGSQGLSLLQRCAELKVAQHCVIVSGTCSTQRSEEVKEIGALGFIKKNSLIQDFKNSLVSTLKGEATYQDSSSPLLCAALLTPRQQEMLCLLQRGFSSKKIAAQLGISPGTVDNHVAALVRRFGASGRMHAVAMAIELGLLDGRQRTHGPQGDEDLPTMADAKL